MSIWKKFDNDDDDELSLNHEEYEQWLDSLEGEGTTEEKYNREMAKQPEYPEVMVQSANYTMTYSNN